MPSQSRNPNQRVVFIHIQKTAGTSIVAALKNQAGSNLPSHGDFESSPQRFYEENRFILGHFGFNKTLEIPDPKFCFTFLRDPIDRIISHYYSLRNENRNEHPYFQLAKQMDLDAFLASDIPAIRSHIDNVQTWTFVADCWGAERAHRQHLSKEQLLEIAKANLATLDFIGFQETYRHDSELLFRMLGYDAPVGNVAINKTANRPRREDLQVSTLRLLAPLVDLDHQLYQYALELRERRGMPVPTRQPRRPVSEPPNPCSPQGVKLLAFHLPQFHPIPENDAWWGEGFTEWTNVRPAQPLYPGHDQPRVPGELGYYSLEDASILERQAELARSHGIYGFCFYHYWFGGKKLLAKPLQEMIRSGRPDFPFCVIWANETWTRRWDGRSQDILLEQTYSEDDAKNFARDLVPLFQDSRYIRVDGKPMLLVYRPADIPDPVAYTRIWRDVWREAGIGEVHLVCALATAFPDPLRAGFDAAVEFPPHKSIFPYPKKLDPEQVGLGPEFKGRAYDYRDFVTNHLQSEEPYYSLYQALMLRWDNTARLKGNSTMWLHCDPTVYTLWLARTVARAIKRHPVAERFVFINAWNEWAEGTYLEPDATFGDQFLRATRSTLLCSDSPNPVFDALAARMQLTQNDPKAHRAACLELRETLNRFSLGDSPQALIAQQKRVSTRSRLNKLLDRLEVRFPSLAVRVLRPVRDLVRRLRMAARFPEAR
jgi:hypothetical protein